MTRARTRFQLERAAAALPRSAAELMRAGVTEGQLRGPNWRRSTHGFHVPASAAMTPTQRILDVVPLVPAGGALTGWAAAYVHGVDQLDGTDPRTMTALSISICLGRDVGRRKSEGVCFTREPLALTDVRLLSGLPVTSGQRAVFDGMRVADGLEEAVAFADACAHAGLATIADLASYVRHHARWKGIEQARRAVELAHPAARSTWESRLRVFCVRELSMASPLVNVPIFDLGGALLGVPDLLLEDEGVVLEFDGSEHRDRHQHRRDNIREEAFESVGLVVARVDSLDLRPSRRASLKRRLMDSVRRGAARDRMRDRWTTKPPTWWVDEVERGEILSDHEKAEIFQRLDEW